MKSQEVYTAKSQGVLESTTKSIQELQGGEVRVKIYATSVSRGDVHMLDNDWGDSPYPAVPGHEAIGVIAAVGSEVEESRVGSVVGVGYQQSACFTCRECSVGLEQFCREQQVAFYDRDGTWAEYVTLDSRFAFDLPESLVEHKNATLFSTGLTVFSGIMRARLTEASSVAVYGMGGLGHLAIQFLAKMGHDVTVISHQADKEEQARAMGASQFILTDGLELPGLDSYGFDFILSTVNAEFDLEAVIRLLMPRGVLCVVGLPQAKISLHAASLADYAQKTIYGSYIGSIKDMKDMLEFVEVNEVWPSAQEFSFDSIPGLLDDVRQMKPRFRYIAVR